MELSFIFNSLLRRWYLVVAGALIGLLLASQVGSETGITYESRALLNVAPPSSASVGSFFDPDRYIAGQITVLDGRELAEDVAATVQAAGMDLAPNQVRGMTTAEQRPGTNIVEIVVQTDDATVAQKVAQTYADEYLLGQRQRAEQFNAAELEALIKTEADLISRISDYNAEISAAVAAWQAENPREADGTVPNIPPASVLAPEAETFRQITVQELNQVKTARTELELVATSKANSEIVSQANEPRLPVSSDDALLVLAGGVFGAILGLAVAVLWSGLSSTVLDDEEAAEIIGQPLTATVQVRSVSRSGVEKALTDVSPKYAGAVESLAVRCEATGGLRDPLVICVVGTERGAGSTSLSVALAERFANVGARVVLVDGDGRYPELTHASKAASALGIAELFTTTASGEPRPFSDHLAPLDQRVSLLGLGGWSGEVGLRSSAVERVLEAARSGGDVVIVDAGPLLDSASANQFVHESDVVVLTMPARGQKARDLTHVVRALDCDPERLLVVNTHVVGRRRAKILGAGTSTPPRPAPIETAPPPAPKPAPTSEYQPTERSFSRWSREAEDAS